MADYIIGKGYLWQPVTGVTKFRFVKAGTVTQSATAVTGVNDITIGVVQETVSTTDAATGKVVIPVWEKPSRTRVVAGAAIAKGAKVAPMADGRAQTAVTGQTVAGIAWTAAAAAGDEIEVDLVAALNVIP
jgi:predicted RecA/RadA family phage recombinase